MGLIELMGLMGPVGLIGLMCLMEKPIFHFSFVILHSSFVILPSLRSPLGGSGAYSSPASAR